MVKVIELVPTMSTGGAEAMVKDYALLMDPQKIEMKVVVLDRHYSSENERLLEEHHIETLYLGAKLYGDRENLNIFQKIRRNLSRYHYFRQFILKEKPDIIHIHLRIGAYLKVLPIRRMRIQLYYTVHNVIENYFDKKPSFKQHYFEYREADRLIHKYGMTLIALHDDMNRQLREYFHTENVITVNNGIVLDKFQRELYDREAVRRMLFVSKEEFLVGHVGRLHEQKNHDMILRVFTELLKTKPQSKLLLIGKGERKAEILQQITALGIKDRVIMLENRGDIPQLMSAMDVFLFPSKWEGYGNVLIEAQSMGLRCIISRQVPDSVRLTNRVVVLDLEAPLQEWVQALCDDTILGEAAGSLKEHDMVNCVKKLENLYLSGK